MKAFSYVAYTDGGRRRTGTVVAETETHAAEELKSKGLFLSEISKRAARRDGSFFRARLSAD